MRRYLEKVIKKDLQEKMVFVGGPRQVGKTTMSLHILGSKDESHPAYLNWDIPRVQRSLVKGEFPADQNLVILDEIHKYKSWRNLVKGFYDGHKSRTKFLITGSARLDFFRKGGDSLQGRYFYYRLHPLSLYELNSTPSENDLKQLIEFGGFPEPFLKANKRSWKRWQLERGERVIQEDLVSLEQVKDVSQLKLLSSLLPEKVSSTLSISNIKQDLNVAYETVDRWIGILENLYFCFRIQAYGFSDVRAAKKDKKLYLWDWSLVENEGARFENLVASHLLKHCHFHQDNEGDKMELRYFKDSQKKELDFVVLKNGKPLFGVECKMGERDISSNLKKFSKTLPIPKYYQVHLGNKHVELKEYKTEIIPFLQFAKFLSV